MVTVTGPFGPVNGAPPDGAAPYHHERLADGQACLTAALGYLTTYAWSALAVCGPDHLGVGRTHGQKCKSPGKAPWGDWKRFQLTLPTADELTRKWRDNPALNCGMTLGGVTRLVGLDVDEAGGEELLRRLSAGDLPVTLEFTSGKGRRLLYLVPPGVELRPTPKPGGEAVENGELRLLGLGSQTVMPPSRHPTGRYYRWAPGRGPGEVEPPVAPAWVVALMRDGGRSGRSRRGGECPRRNTASGRPASPALVFVAIDTLFHLSPQRAEHYDDWLHVGMALHSVSDCEVMLGGWDEWSQSCPAKYQEGVCAAHWASFRRDGGLNLVQLAEWAYRDTGWTRARLPRGGAL
jgi:hypothetical protein